MLETEETRKGDAFEVVGIKFPSETTKWAGFVVLCGIQLYFGILLSERRSSSAHVEPAAEIAWIGFYQSAISRILLFVTIILLPAFAFIAMAFAKVNSQTSPVRIAGLSCACIALLAISLCTWISLLVFRREFVLSQPKAKNSHEC